MATIEFLMATPWLSFIAHIVQADFRTLLSIDYTDSPGSFLNNLKNKSFYPKDRLRVNIMFLNGLSYL